MLTFNLEIQYLFYSFKLLDNSNFEFISTSLVIYILLFQPCIIIRIDYPLPHALVMGLMSISLYSVQDADIGEV